MRSITLHNIDEDLYQKLAEIAQRQNLSFNATAKTVLGDAVGIDAKRKKRDLSWLFAKKWTEEESKSFDKAITDSEKIDEEDWK